MTLRPAILLIVAFIITDWTDLYAQAYHFKTYSVNDGLPHGQVFDINQTADGYMWIGTSGGGLSRFDGHTFQNFTINEGLRDDMINFVYESTDQKLWTATFEGGVAYLEGNRFIYQFEGSLLDSTYITSMAEAPDGSFWFTTYQNGLFVYTDGNLTHITEEDGLAADTVWDLMWNDDGSVWIATNKGIFIFDGERFRHLDTSDGISGERVYNFTTDQDGIIWISTSNGFTLYEDGEFRAVHEINGRSLNFVFYILNDSAGNIWIGTENDGVYKFDGETYTHITKREGLSSNYIYRILEDKNGNIWIGTDENGVSIFRGEDFKFYSTENGMNSNRVLSLNKTADGTIWIGTERGLESLKNGNFRSYDVPVSDPLYANVWEIEQLPNGDLLLLMENNTLFRFDGNNFTNYSETHGFGDWFIMDILVDSKENLWIGTDENLIKFDGANFLEFTIADGLPGSLVYHIMEDREGNLWVGTNNGAGRFDGETFHNIRPADGLGHYNVNYIFEQDNGNFWLGTSGGVTLYEPSKSTEYPALTNFGRNDGMRLVETLSIWYDKENGQLWQGTNGGFHRLDVNQYFESGKMQIEHFSLASHGVGIGTSHKAVIQDDEGNFWIGTKSGIVIQSPHTITTVPTPPELYLTALRFNGIDPDWESFEQTPEYILGRPVFPEISFPYGRNSYTFEFTALEYIAPENIEYRYRVTGFDSEWRDITDHNTATYTNLAPGNYEFHVQARIQPGSWSAAEIYPFSVQSPYWMATWFWILMASLFMFGVYAFTRIRLQILERDKLAGLVEEQTKYLREALQEKEVLLKEIHHRVKNNLAVIYGLLELQSAQSDDEKTIAVLRESSLRVNSIALVHERLYQNDRLSHIEAKNYIPDLINAIKKSMYTNAKIIEHDIHIDDIVLTLEKGIPSGLLLNELISNIYKHAFEGRDSGKFEVSFKDTGKKYKLTVSDNGVGLPVDFETSRANSLGIQLIKTLTVQLKGKLKIDSDESGTTFEILMEK